jgi:hypothetical protein
MIISASYKTDIPTFYGEWFMRRLRAGYCRMVNPYGRQIYQVSLRREDVSGIVFWTKNVAPFLRHLPEVRDRGFPFVLQHTINGYPRALETSVVDANRAVESLRKVRDRFGPRVVVWRYDTIVISSLTPLDFHVENFSYLAEALRGITDEAVISFAHFYRKTKRNMDISAREVGFQWRDPSLEEKHFLVNKLLDLARDNGMRLSICSQPDYLVEGSVEAQCIDAQRLEDIAGRPIVSRVKGNRKACGCFESRDIGEYDTCPHGCVYCYAVQNREFALARFRMHDPASEFLLEPAEGDSLNGTSGRRQLPLFPK